MNGAKRFWIVMLQFLPVASLAVSLFLAKLLAENVYGFNNFNYLTFNDKTSVNICFIPFIAAIIASYKVTSIFVLNAKNYLKLSLLRVILYAVPYLIYTFSGINSLTYPFTWGFLKILSLASYALPLVIIFIVNCYVINKKRRENNG